MAPCMRDNSMLQQQYKHQPHPDLPHIYAGAALPRRRLASWISTLDCEEVRSEDCAGARPRIATWITTLDCPEASMRMGGEAAVATRPSAIEFLNSSRLLRSPARDLAESPASRVWSSWLSNRENTAQHSFDSLRIPSQCSKEPASAFSSASLIATTLSSF